MITCVKHFHLYKITSYQCECHFYCFLKTQTHGDDSFCLFIFCPNQRPKPKDIQLAVTYYKGDAKNLMFD